MKRTWYIPGISLLVLVGALVAVVLAVGHTKHIDPIAGHRYEVAAAQKPVGPCLSETSPTALTATERTGIENTLVSQLMDVPAGTNATIHIHSYDGTHATGSELYDGKYGSYNFSAVKIHGVSSGAYITWTVQSFVACTR